MLFTRFKVKGVSLGAAAVLFFSIVLTAWAQVKGYNLEINHDLGVMGLALFAFAIGIMSGPNFFHTVKSALGPNLAMILTSVIAAATAGIIGRILHLDWAIIAGTFAGATTNTPTLSAAAQASGNAASATVGYAISYLFGVIGILGWSMFALSKRRQDKDAPSPIVNLTVRVERKDKPLLQDILHAVGGDLR